MIREATILDMNGINKLISDFNEVYGDIIFSCDRMYDVIKKCILDNQIVLVIESNNEIVGGICGMVSKNFTNDEDVMQEIFFYIKQGYGFWSKALINKLEDICREKNLKSIIIASMGDNTRLDRMYQLFGYKLLEKHFIKCVV